MNKCIEECNYVYQHTLYLQHLLFYLLFIVSEMLHILCQCDLRNKKTVDYLLLMFAIDTSISKICIIQS